MTMHRNHFIAHFEWDSLEFCVPCNQRDGELAMLDPQRVALRSLTRISLVSIPSRQRSCWWSAARDVSAAQFLTKLIRLFGKQIAFWCFPTPITHRQHADCCIAGRQVCPPHLNYVVIVKLCMARLLQEKHLALPLGWVFCNLSEFGRLLFDRRVYTEKIETGSVNASWNSLVPREYHHQTDPTTSETALSVVSKKLLTTRPKKKSSSCDQSVKYGLQRDYVTKHLEAITKHLYPKPGASRNSFMAHALGEVATQTYNTVSLWCVWDHLVQKFEGLVCTETFARLLHHPWITTLLFRQGPWVLTQCDIYGMLEKKLVAHHKTKQLVPSVSLAVSKFVDELRPEGEKTSYQGGGRHRRTLTSTAERLSKTNMLVWVGLVANPVVLNMLVWSNKTAHNIWVFHTKLCYFYQTEVAGWCHLGSGEKLMTLKRALKLPSTKPCRWCIPLYMLSGRGRTKSILHIVNKSKKLDLGVSTLRLEHTKVVMR